LDLAAVFLLSLLGGYFFAAWWKVTAYATRRSEGHHLYFRAALCGVIFFACALALRTYGIPHSPRLQSLDAALIDYVKPALKEESGLPAAAQERRAQWVATALYSLVLGPLSAFILNRFTPSRWAQQLTVRGLDEILLRAQREEMPVSLTLNTGKVYIGLVVSITDPEGDPTMLKLLPMFSGHRDEQGRLTLTTDYQDVYAKLRSHQEQKLEELNLASRWIEQFYLAVRADMVVSASLFAPGVYAYFNPDWKQKIAAARDKKSEPQELIVQIKRTGAPVASRGGVSSGHGGAAAE
jgi:hypothetical protein